MPRLTESQIHSVLSVNSVEGVENFLSEIGANSTDQWRWLPLGGRANNAGSVNLATDPGQALVERITNALDAHIELQYERLGRPQGLESPRSAVSRLWGLGTGRLSRETDIGVNLIEKMAPLTCLSVMGSTRPRGSTVVVEDRGIGQHPGDFEDTVLSLGESNKISKSYLMGAFGQGGSSTFYFCPYSVIISRRNEVCIDGKPDLVGWTIVRKYDDDSLKVYRYEFLCEADGSIPTVDPRYLNEIGVEFTSGTKFVHIGYDLGRINSAWSLVGYRFFDNLLFDPVLPYRIADLRRTPPVVRNMFGARNRLDQVGLARKPEAQNYETDLSRWGGEGRDKIRYWFFKPSGDMSVDSSGESSTRLDSYLDFSGSPRSILFTLNGQRHHVQGKALIRKQRMAALADYLLIHVDCDDLSLRLKKEIFPATRAGATTGESREELLLNAVRDALKDPWLRQKLHDVIQGRQEQVTDASAKRVSRMLDGLITRYRVERTEGGRRGSAAGGSNDRSENKRRTQDPPTYLRFADKRPFECEVGSTSTLYLQTDGPDDLLNRRRRRASIRFESEGNVVYTVSDMNKGRIPVTVTVPAALKPGYRTQMLATLELPPTTILPANRALKLIPPPPPYEGNDPPTKFEFARNSVLNVETGSAARAKIKTDATNDVLNRATNPAVVQAKCNDPSKGVSIWGPKDGEFTAELTVPKTAAPGDEGNLSATLHFDDGSIFTASRPYKIVPPTKRSNGGGNNESNIPSYEVTKVWQSPPETQPDAVTWQKMPGRWDENKIGSWEENEERLFLYVNMDEKQFRGERRRLSRGSIGTHYVDRLTDRYVAYVAFHLFQLHDQSLMPEDQSNMEFEQRVYSTEFDRDSLVDDPDSDLVIRELSRVAATLIHTLRSETEVQRLESEAMTDVQP